MKHVEEQACGHAIFVKDIGILIDIFDTTRDISIAEVGEFYVELDGEEPRSMTRKDFHKEFRFIPMQTDSPNKKISRWSDYPET